MFKKIYCLLLLVFLSSFGYASQKTLSIENNRLVWDYAGSLPAQKGFDKNIGTAGLLQGIIGDYIVVGGGANFPEALEKGGKKITHKDLYLLKLALEVQSVVDDDVRPPHLADVPRAGLIEVRVDSGPHQAVHRDVGSADDSGQVGEHRRRGDDPHSLDRKSVV